MKIHAISTGTVKITENWRVGRGESQLARLKNTLLDSKFTGWLPIYCWVIEHPDGLIVIDTGIPENANDPIYFPPFMPLVQRAAKFDITKEAEIGPMMRSRGLAPEDARWVVLTHLHQDHEGGLHYFPNAEFVVSRTEWEAARGFKGRMAGYLNWRWPKNFQPTLVDFDGGSLGAFEGSHTLTRGVHLVPTPGHSDGHLSVIVEDGDHSVFFAGDASYTDASLIAGTVDGVGTSAPLQRDTHARILAYARENPIVYLPSHDPEGDQHLNERRVLPVGETEVTFA